jgi:hypothetical protein
MTHASGDDANRRLHLDDLHVGQSFVSDAHALDEKQVIAAAPLAASGWPTRVNSQHWEAERQQRDAIKRWDKAEETLAEIGQSYNVFGSTIARLMSAPCRQGSRNR